MGQAASTVLMVEPAAFAPNPDSARTNAFSRVASDESAKDVHSRALAEFRLLADRLRAEGIDVLVRREAAEVSSPDALFPNNWVSFHEDGRVVLYPLEPPSRRRERHWDLVGWLREEHGFRVSEVVDLTSHENEGRFLEGTGSLVVDRPRGVVYASISPRTTPSLLDEYGRRFGLEVVPFHAFDSNGVPVYHTNVVLALGAKTAVLCRDAIRDPEERRKVSASLDASGRERVEISLSQLHAFAGNMLELEDSRKRSLWVLSERARSSLERAQIRKLERGSRLVASPVPTIEEYGGGSVRCMLAEVFLPRAS
jgi:hypothetical protein